VDLKSILFINKNSKQIRMRGKTDGLTRGIIIGSLLGLILGGIIGYMLHSNINGNFAPKGNFQIDEQTKIEIQTFFNSTSDMSEIKSYCDSHIANCFYYCRNVNQDHEICSELGNYTGMPGGRQWSP